MAPIQPSKAEFEKRKIVGIGPDRVTNVSSTDFPGHFPGEEHAWNLERFEENFQVQIHYNEQFESSFSLIGLDASIANAFRRILIAEVPTVAIEYVYVHNNTTIIQDEVLAHRLGLVPLRGSVSGFDWMNWFKKPTDEDQGTGASDKNTIVLRLKVACTKNENAAKDEVDPRELYHNAHVYAKQLTFHPVGRQVQKFAGPEGAVQAVNPDILLAKMRPGQEIDIEMHCIKGIGMDHAKFSPVATASYRLLPTVTIKRPIFGKDARKFARCFPKGVIALEPVTAEEAQIMGSGYEGHKGEMKAVVKNTFRDTVSRECLRHEEFKGKVELGRVRDHFIFSVESTGQYDSDRLFLESIKVLKIKCSRLKRDLINLRT